MKKEYINPELEVFKLKMDQTLLNASPLNLTPQDAIPDPDDDEYYQDL